MDRAKQTDNKLIHAVVGAVNESRMSEADAHVPQNKRGTHLRPVRPSGKWSKEMEELILRDAADAEAFWNDYWQQDREWITRALLAISAHKRVLLSDMDNAVSSFEAGTEVEPSVAFDKRGRPSVGYRLRFNEVAALASYVILRLASDDAPAHFGLCKYCDEFFVDERHGQGKRRSEYCSRAHANAQGQRDYRARQLKSKATGRGRKGT